MELSNIKIGYECPILRVEERRYILENGKQETHFVVVRQPNVSVVALTNDKEIILIKEHRGKSQKIVLELPSGKLDEFDPSSEKLMDQAIQELKEETGFIAKNIQLINTIEEESNWIERKYYSFAAWDLDYVGQKLEAGEKIEVLKTLCTDIDEETKLEFPDEQVALKKALEFFKNEKLI